MYFLFSGEGPTDLGCCSGNAQACEGDRYHHGPMTVVVDQIVDARHNYSLLETRQYGFVSRRMLTDRASELKAAKKEIRLPGKKRTKETRYFFNNARVLARIAKERERKLKDQVVAVLFRDADTGTAGRGTWDAKRKSTLDGFDEERFPRGVPMIPKPTSEAWILCGMRPNSGRGSPAIEDRSGSRKSRQPLKSELEDRLGHPVSREELCEIVAERRVDIERIAMPSFVAFRSRLENVI